MMSTEDLKSIAAMEITFLLSGEIADVQAEVMKCNTEGFKYATWVYKLSHFLNISWNNFITYQRRLKHRHFKNNNQ